ncbi:protein ENL isoform X2 [Diceros bicornis minor]|uniref:protein ENL isoform X2 n=1 Tax=Diceros bicornis minor TaxID=77932 RepID=UPI0026EB3435|nr:protein ENL isoform X2 [Diceros bicornis minor]
MDNQCTVQVKLELGHRAQLRKKPTTEGFTHDWMVFVRGPEQCEIQHFVEKVVFRLHDSFPKPKRVCKEPPYKVEESGYAGFIMPIEVYFKNKEEPRKVCFTYDLFLNLEGNPPVNHLRCEKLTFNNPTIEFRYKLLMAGGDASRESGKACKTHKTTKEHRERPRKDSESKGAPKEAEREQARSAKDAARKPGEGRPPKEEKAPPPKAAFKEPKMALKETKLESVSPKGGPPPPPKSSSKRPAAADSPKPSAKKQKKSSSKGSRSAPSTSPRTPSSSFSDRKPTKDKGGAKGEKAKAEGEPREVKKAPEVEESNSEDEASFKTESAQSSPSNSSSSSDSSSDSDFEPSQNHSQGPLRSMVEDLQSEESDEDDSSSGEEAAVKTNAGRDSRLSFSDSESDNSADSCLPSREPPPPKKPPPPNSKASGRRSPESGSKPEKILKRGTYDKAYTDELVELHRRLMALRERNVLQQIVNLIEETGHFNVTNTTFDFDLFSLDETTVRKLQSYLEAVAT